MRFENRGKLIAVLLIPCFLYLGWMAGSRGLADAYARSAIWTLEKWKLEMVKLDADDWKVLQRDISLALKLDPTNPELQQWMGVTIEGPYLSYLSDSVEGDIERQKAAVHFREAIRLQPTWPHAWNDLSRVKFRLSEIDQEYYEAVHKAAEMGPWEPVIQDNIISMGVVSWEQLPEAEKPVFLQVMSNSLQHGNRTHAMKMFDFLYKTDHIPDIAPINPHAVIRCVMGLLEQAQPETIKSMLVLLDENSLFAKLTVADNQIMKIILNTARLSADQTYRDVVMPIMEKHNIN